MWPFNGTARISLIARLCLSQTVAFQTRSNRSSNVRAKFLQGQRRIGRELSHCQLFDFAIDDDSTIAITTHPARALAFQADDLTDIRHDDEARRDCESAGRIAPDDLHPDLAGCGSGSIDGLFRSPFQMQTFALNSCASTTVRTEKRNPILHGRLCCRKASVSATKKTLLRMHIIWITTRAPAPLLPIT